jgi:uncharacterized membrane protein
MINKLTNRIRHINDKVKSNSYLLFLVDGLGAVFTFVLLTFLINKTELFNGIPNSYLSKLSLLPLLLALISLSTYFIKPIKWRWIMNSVAILNLTYCIITFTLSVLFFKDIKAITIFFFLSEAVVIIPLSLYEYQL